MATKKQKLLSSIRTDKDELSKLVLGYLTCALWAENDESTPQGGEPFDQNYDLSDFAYETLREVWKECQAFLDANRAYLDAYANEYTPKGGYDVWECAGHDFWLTRNGHGAGFWDRGLGELGKRLTTASHNAKGRNIYLSRGKIYQCQA